MPLKAAEIRASQPRKNAYKMADERGLFLLIQPSGARLWRLKYRFRGYEKKLNLGKYPEIGLAEARERRDEARRLIASGIDPAVARKQAALEAAMSQATTFRVVADEYIEKMAWEGKSASTLVKMRWFNTELPLQRMFRSNRTASDSPWYATVRPHTLKGVPLNSPVMSDQTSNFTPPPRAASSHN